VPTEIPGAEAIVQIWERGRHEHPVDRALTMLSLLSGQPRPELARLSVEHRDCLLLGWRERLFGRAMTAWAACPACGCGVDVSLTVDDPEPPEDRFTVEVAGTPLTVRMPTSLDLAAVAGCQSVDEARRRLVGRCLEGAPAGPDEGQAADDDRLVTAVEAELDRRAGVSAGTVELRCPDCADLWALEVDVAAFAWREIEILAGRLLAEVDVLARRYGWSERDILALSPDRRRFYLELAS
jgi:hypothetical protein